MDKLAIPRDGRRRAQGRTLPELAARQPRNQPQVYHQQRRRNDDDKGDGCSRQPAIERKIEHQQQGQHGQHDKEELAHQASGQSAEHVPPHGFDDQILVNLVLKRSVRLHGGGNRRAG